MLKEMREKIKEESFKIYRGYEGVAEEETDLVYLSKVLALLDEHEKKLENWTPPNNEPLTDQTILLLKEILAKG